MRSPVSRLMERQGRSAIPSRHPESELRRAVVLLSGGLDSTVTLWWALNHYDDVTAVMVDWGQSTAPEGRAARRIAAIAGVRLRTVRLATPGLDLRPTDFTRGHNFALIGAAALHVGPRQSDILLGSLRTDRHADATIRFMDDATVALAGPQGTGAVRVIAPLLDLEDKAEVIREGLDLGAPVGYSWSCNRARRPPACEQCPSCCARAAGWGAALEQLESEKGLTPQEVRVWSERLESWTHQEPRKATGLVGAEMSTILSHRDEIPWKTGWSYRDPNHVVRFTHTTHPSRRHRARYGWRATPYVRVRVGDDDQSELVLLSDGRITAQTGSDEETLRALAGLIAEHPR